MSLGFHCKALTDMYRHGAITKEEYLTLKQSFCINVDVIATDTLIGLLSLRTLSNRQANIMIELGELAIFGTNEC